MINKNIVAWQLKDKVVVFHLKDGNEITISNVIDVEVFSYLVTKDCDTL